MTLFSYHINSRKINNDNPRITHLRENIGVTIYDKIPVNVTRVTHVNRVHSLPRDACLFWQILSSRTLSQNEDFPTENGIPKRQRFPGHQKAGRGAS